jgi:hypothetical protein
MADVDPVIPEAGVPQGGPLSPLIYIVAMDYINTHIALHAKDAAISMSNENFHMENDVLSLS